jgi:hypothetical protein
MGFYVPKIKNLLPEDAAVLIEIGHITVGVFDNPAVFV